MAFGAVRTLREKDRLMAIRITGTQTRMTFAAIERAFQKALTEARRREKNFFIMLNV